MLQELANPKGFKQTRIGTAFQALVRVGRPAKSGREWARHRPTVL